MRKYVSEFVGTLVLVAMGCGVAMLVGTEAASGAGYALTALAFGLAVVAMAYSIGNISGCHVNPAISLGAFIRGDMGAKDFLGYVVAQLLGGFAGALLLMTIFNWGGITDMTGCYAANGLAGVGGSPAAGLLVEVVLTFIFVMVFLGVTSEEFAHGNVAGLVIGLSLTLVHLFGIGLTGTSVNPARSLGPAIVAMMAGNAVPMSSVWVFIFAPLLGAGLATFVYRGLEGRAEWGSAGPASPTTEPPIASRVDDKDRTAIL